MPEAYLLKISDASGHCKVLLALDEAKVEGTAEDLIFSLLGEADPKALVAEKTLGEQYLPEFENLRKIIFDRDEQGLFIRDGIGFSADQKDVEPDAPMRALFKRKANGDMTFYSCNLSVQSPESRKPELKAGQIKEFSLLFLIHMIAIGKKVDVIKVDPDLAEAISEAEEKNLLFIDTKNAVYRLSPQGEKMQAAMIEEAQDLIRHFDIYADVEIEPSGKILFNGGQGDDLRIPVWEQCGISPFRARFVLGLNDEEWDELPDWNEAVDSPAFYDEIFAPVETAPTVEEIGNEEIERVIAEGRRRLREG